MSTFRTDLRIHRQTYPSLQSLSTTDFGPLTDGKISFRTNIMICNQRLKEEKHNKGLSVREKYIMFD